MPTPKLIIPADEWRAMMQAHAGGDSPGTIAKRYGYNPNTVKSRLRQAGSRRGQDKGAQNRENGNNTLLSKELYKDNGNGSVTSDTNKEASQEGAKLGGQVIKTDEDLHVQEQERQRLTLIRRHQTQANKMRSLLKESMREAKANTLSVKDLETLSRVHERLVKVDRLIFELEGAESSGGNTLINKGVIVVPAKSGAEIETWAATVAEALPAAKPS